VFIKQKVEFVHSTRSVTIQHRGLRQRHLRSQLWKHRSQNLLPLSLESLLPWVLQDISASSPKLGLTPFEGRTESKFSFTILSPNSGIFEVAPGSTLLPYSSAFPLHGSLPVRSYQAPCSPSLSLPTSLTSTRVLSFLIQEQNQPLRLSESFLF